MDQIEDALSLFKEGYSWTQAILAGFGEPYGIDRQTAFKLGRSFGAGMGLGIECGAVTGAFMVIGLSIRQPKDEKDARFKAYDLVKRFKNRFEAAHGTILCKDLLGVDVGTREGREKAVKENLYQTLCPGYVKTAGEILKDLRWRECAQHKHPRRNAWDFNVKDCIFCQIIRGEKSAELVYQGESVIAFKDIKPHAPVHILLVPKNHIRSINDLVDEDRPVISELVLRAQKIAEELGIHRSGYKLVFNVERGGGQYVFHLHLHLIGGW